MREIYKFSIWHELCCNIIIILKHYLTQLFSWTCKKQPRTWFDSMSSIKKFNFVTLLL